jgi:hypothetical protein
VRCSALPEIFVIGGGGFFGRGSDALSGDLLDQPRSAVLRRAAEFEDGGISILNPNPCGRLSACLRHGCILGAGFKGRPVVDSDRAARSSFYTTFSGGGSHVRLRRLADDLAQRVADAAQHRALFLQTLAERINLARHGRHARAGLVSGQGMI